MISQNSFDSTRRQLLADRPQALAILARHVGGDLARAIVGADGEVVAGELDLRLADALQPGLLALEPQRLVELEEHREHLVVEAVAVAGVCANSHSAETSYATVSVTKPSCMS